MKSVGRLCLMTRFVCLSVATTPQELTGLAKMRLEADAVEMLWLDDDDEELSVDGEGGDSDGEPPELHLTLKEDGDEAAVEKGPSTVVAAAPAARTPVQEQQGGAAEARAAADTTTNGNGGGGRSGAGDGEEEVVEVA